MVLALTALGLVGTALPAGAWTPLRTILVLPLALVLPGYALTTRDFRASKAGAAGTPRARAQFVARHHGAHKPVPLPRLVRADAALLGSRRSQLSPWVRPSSPRLFLRRLNDGPKPDTRRLASRPFLRPLPIAIAVAAACLAAGAVVLARTPLSSPSASGYTALWLTHKPHSAALTVGVRSEEHHRTRYRLRLVLAGHVSRRRFALAPGETWQRTLPPVPHAAASLYRAGHPGVYRSVRFTQPSRTGP